MKKLIYLLMALTVMTALPLQNSEAYLWIANKGSQEIVVLDESTAKTTRISSVKFPETVYPLQFNNECLVYDSSKNTIMRINRFGDVQDEFLINYHLTDLIYVGETRALWLFGANTIEKFVNRKEVFSVENMQNPTSCCYSPADTKIYFIEKGTTTVKSINDNGMLKTEIDDLLYPVALKVDPADNSLWVFDSGSSTLYKYDLATRKVLLKNTGYSNVSQIEISRQTDSVYLLQADNNAVSVLNRKSGQETKNIVGFNKPLSVAVNDRDGSIWVSDKDNIILFPEGEEKNVIIYYNFNNPLKIAYQEKTPEDYSLNLIRFPEKAVFFSSVK